MCAIACRGNFKGMRETRYCYDCGEQEHIGVNCPYKWTNSIDEEGDRRFHGKVNLEEEESEELASLEAA